MTEAEDQFRRQLSDLIAASDSWQGLKSKLEALGLTERMGADGMAEVARAWSMMAATALTDPQLISELRHWADGLGYREHLQGFEAIPPEVLAQEARRRGWFVRDMPSALLVSPPGVPPVKISR